MNAYELASSNGSLALDTVFGERFTFQAMMVAPAGVNHPRVPDTSRPNFIANGVFVAAAKAIFPHARGSTADDNAQRTAVTMPRVSVDRRLMAWTVQQFDRVTREKTGDTFEIAKAMPGDAMRTLFYLTARAR